MYRVSVFCFVILQLSSAAAPALVQNDADTLFEKKHYEEAERLYRQLIESTECSENDLVHLYRRLVECIFYQEKYDDALSVYQHAALALQLDIDPILRMRIAYSIAASLEDRKYEGIIGYQENVLFARDEEALRKLVDISSADNTITVIGIGFSPIEMTGSPQGRLMARRAARLDAYLWLLRQIRARSGRSIWHRRILGIVRGAKITDTVKLTGDAYMVIMSKLYR